MSTLLQVGGIFLLGIVVVKFISGFIEGMKATFAGDAPTSSAQPADNKKASAVQDDNEEDDEQDSYCRVCGGYSRDLDSLGECWSCAGDDDKHFHRRH